MCKWNRVFLAGLLVTLMSVAAQAWVDPPLPEPPVVICPPDGVCVEKIYFSIESDCVILGTSFEDEDIICIDVAAGTASTFWEGDGPNAPFKYDEDVDAIGLNCDQSQLYLSTKEDAYLPNGMGGYLHFYEGDVVCWDLAGQSATLLFDASSVLGCNPDIDGFEILCDGTILFSISGNDIKLENVWYEDNDIIHYDPDAEPGSKFSKYFDGDAHDITKYEDIDAFALLCCCDEQYLVFSIDGDCGSPVNAKDEDLILYANGEFKKFLDSSVELGFSGNIDALEIICCPDEPPPQVPGVPEPLTMSLFGISVLSGWAWKRRRQA